MNKKTLLLYLIAVMPLFGCGSFWRGTATGGAVGVAGTGATYELRAKDQLDYIEKEFQAGRMTKEEYDIRKDQIQKDSLIY